MDMDMNKMLEALEQVEEVADDIIASKEQIVDLDRRRNKNREASRALSKSKDKKIWLNFGGMFVKTTTQKAKEIINEDQEELNKGITTLRDEMKEKVSTLRQLEGKPQLKGWHLQALSSDEVSALRDLLPQTI
jgi:chaperonin cofactor prefoldin